MLHILRSINQKLTVVDEFVMLVIHSDTGTHQKCVPVSPPIYTKYSTQYIKAFIHQITRPTGFMGFFLFQDLVTVFKNTSALSLKAIWHRKQVQIFAV